MGKSKRISKIHLQRMTGDIEDAIWRDINKSGVPLELQVASIISETAVPESARWHVATNQYYVDLDEGKGRQLDTKAHCELQVSTNGFNLAVDYDLLVECKKLPGHAWIFFLSDKKPALKNVPVFSMLSGKYPIWEFETLHRDVEEQHPIIASLCSHYHETIVDEKKTNKQRTNIFEATMVLGKATQYDILERRKGSRQGLEDYLDELYPSSDIPLEQMQIENAAGLWDFVNFFRPILVFEGLLYVCQLNPKRLQRAKALRFPLSYRSGKYDIRDLPIDICTIEYFPHYMKQLTLQLKNLKSLLFREEKGKVWLEKYQEETVQRIKDWEEERRFRRRREQPSSRTDETSK